MTKETSVNGQVEKKNEQGALDSLTGYYTKTQVDARLNLKADITDTELKKYDMYPDPTNHPGWIVSFRQRRMGMDRKPEKGNSKNKTPGSERGRASSLHNIS